jgi:hypothetical protein
MFNLSLLMAHTLPDITRVMKSRKVSWARHVACMEIKGLHTKFWSENLKGRDFLEDLDVNGRIFCTAAQMNEV